MRGRAWLCVVVRDREWSCAAVVRGCARSSVVMRGGRAWSCVVVRGSVRRPCVVVRSRARSVVRGRHSLPFCPLRGQRCRAARFAANAAVTHGRTDTHGDGQHIIPPWGGVGQFCYPINVIVSIRTCVPNLGSFRGSVRKNCLLSLIIDR